MGIQESKIVNKSNSNRTQSVECVFSSLHHRKHMTRCVPLHKAALKGNWEEAREILDTDETFIRAPIVEGGETVLHIAAIEGRYELVKHLLSRMEDKDLEILNAKGSTAFCFAAAGGHVDIARIMVEKNVNLPKIKGANGISPLYMAAMGGFDEMAKFLYPKSDFQDWTTEEKVNLLTTVIESELYGLAMSIVEKYPKLAVEKDCTGATPLEVLVRKPFTFCSSSGEGLWATIKTKLSYKKLDTDNSNDSCDAYTLFGCLWDSAIRHDDIETGPNRKLSKLFFLAAESYNEEFLIELILRFPDFLYKVNSSNHSILHIAITHRYVKVFNLMHELGGAKGLIASYIDEDGNNILHLAAKLAPPEQLNTIPGAALQMQREVLWYKEVEKLVRPSCRTLKNSAGQTPYQLFLVEHKELIEGGGSLMKQIAKSCMVVAILIATVVFTAAFTVPGGYNNTTGIPILKYKKIFFLFPVSEAVATLSSLTSMLMFLSILTSRYSDDYFLKYVPLWLVVGVGSLFVSIVAMMVAFCTCLLVFQHGWTIIALFLVFFTSVPITFVILKYHLLVTILRCTYSCTWLFRSNNMLHA